MKAIQLHLIIDSIRYKKDKSLGLSISTDSMTPEEAVELTKLQGNSVMGLLKPMDESPEEVITINQDLKSKSLSTRQRSVLFVLLETSLGRKPTDAEWNLYYTQTMERSIEDIKKQIDELSS